MRFLQITLLIGSTIAALSCGSAEPIDEDLDTLLATSALSTVPATGGCTRNGNYWKTHNAYAARAADRVAWPLAEDKVLCGRRMIDLVNAPIAPGDAWHSTMRQLLATALNVASGAGAPDEVRAALETARGFAPRCVISDARDRSASVQVLRVLDAYNTGRIGPGACP